MRTFSLITIFLFGVTSLAQSQKVIHKSLPVHDQEVDMKFDFADTIRIEAWDKNTLELEVTANIDDNRYNDYYALEVTDQNQTIGLVEKIDYEGIKKEKGTQNGCNCPTEVNYKLKVPPGLKFDLKTIAGKVELVGTTGEMSVNSVSGFIDYAIPVDHQARIGLSTVTGDVYSNVSFDEKPSGKISWAGTTRDLSLNGGSRKVELKTVSGDIYLRKYR